MTSTERRSIGRASVGVTAIVALCHAVFGFPAVRSAVLAPELWTGPTDYAIHTWATTLVFPNLWTPGVPHFGLHVLVRIFETVVPSSNAEIGMIVVTMGFIAGFGGLLFRYFDDRLAASALSGTLAAAALSMLVAFSEAPTAVLGWSYQMPPNFFLPLNMPHSPTSIASRLLSMVLFLAVLRVLRGDTHPRTGWLAALTVATMLTKPNLAPTLAVVATGWAWLDARRRPADGRIRTLLLGLVAPVAAAAALQWMIHKFQSPDPYGDRSIRIDPFHDLLMMGGNQPLFWTVLIFPVAVLTLFPRLRHHLDVQIAGGCLLVGAALVTAFRLDGNIPFAADFLHFLQAPILMLTIVLTGHLCGDWEQNRSHHAARLSAVALLALPSAVGGLALWVCQGGGPCLAA